MSSNNQNNSIDKSQVLNQSQQSKDLNKSQNQALNNSQNQVLNKSQNQDNPNQNISIQDPNLSKNDSQDNLINDDSKMLNLDQSKISNNNLGDSYDSQNQSLGLDNINIGVKQNLLTKSNLESLKNGGILKKKPQPQSYSLFDFVYPAGKLARLCQVKDQSQNDFKLQKILKKVNLNAKSPVLIISGARSNNVTDDMSKFLAGVTRACYRTDTIIVDGGQKTGIEQFAIRRGVKLVGIAPESLVNMPKVNPTVEDPNAISNGHSHLFLLQKEKKWGEETAFKFELINQIIRGCNTDPIIGGPPCKAVLLLINKNEETINEIQLAIQQQYPIVYVKSNEFIKDPEISGLLAKAHKYELDDMNSETVASYLHFLLTVSPHIPFIKNEDKNQLKKK